MCKFCEKCGSLVINNTCSADCQNRKKVMPHKAHPAIIKRLNDPNQFLVLSGSRRNFIKSGTV